MNADDRDSPTAPLPGVQADPIQFNRQMGWRTLVLALLLCWPLLLFGQPAYFSDTAPYYKGGRAAIQYVEQKLDPAATSGRDTRPAGAGSADIRDTLSAGAGRADVSGARSIPYSVTAFLLRGPHAAMIPLAILQAVLVAFTIAVFLAGLNLANRLWWVTAVLLVFTTPAAWFTSYAMPDIFAGVTILAIAELAVCSDRVTRPVAIMLALTGAFAIAAHASHVALAMLLLPLAVAWRLWRGRGEGGTAGNRALLWLGAPMLLGILAVVLSGLVGFGEVSLAPKHFPLALARAIDDGPARWYLEAHCREHHFAVCELYPNGFPHRSFDFLWGPNGIRLRATAAQMERIRGEESEILLASAAAYPARQVPDLIGGTARQLVAFDVDEANFNVRTIAGADGSLNFQDDPRLPAAAILWADRISRISAMVATAALAIGLIAARGRMRALAWLLLAGLIERVIWLLPLAALAAWTPKRGNICTGAQAGFGVG